MIRYLSLQEIIFLVLNGFEISATVDEQEQAIFDVTRGSMSRSELSQWLRERITTLRR